MSTTSSQTMPGDRLDQAPDAAVAGRVPVTFRDRMFRRYSTYLLTSGTLGSASYAYLVGASLAGLGTAWIGLVGYALGLILGTVFVALAAGTLSYRSGADAVDASKPSLGTRGAVLMLLGTFASAAGWANVLLAMTSRGMVALLPQGLSAGPQHEGLVVGCALLLVALVGLLLRRGVKTMEKAASWGAVVQMGIAVLVIAMVLWRWGAAATLLHTVPASSAFTADRLLQLSLGVEFGFTNGLGMLAFVGGLSRLVHRRGHTIGPVVLGYPLLGCCMVACAGALASVATGQQELAGMLFGVAGPELGAALLIVIMLTNVSTMVTQIYVAAVSLQQIRTLSSLRWQWVVWIALVPSMLLAFATQWMLDHVMSLLAYGGVMFVGMSTVFFVDYYILRRQQVRIAHLFAVHGQGDYWFKHGVNWPAIVVIVMCCVLYLYWFDPISLRSRGPFEWIGASIPTVLVGGLAYYLMMVAWGSRRGRGGYEPQDDTGVEVAM